MSVWLDQIDYVPKVENDYLLQEAYLPEEWPSSSNSHPLCALCWRCWSSDMIEFVDEVAIFPSSPDKLISALFICFQIEEGTEILVRQNLNIFPRKVEKKHLIRVFCLEFKDLERISFVQDLLPLQSARREG